MINFLRFDKKIVNIFKRSLKSKIFVFFNEFVVNKILTAKLFLFHSFHICITLNINFET